MQDAFSSRTTGRKLQFQLFRQGEGIASTRGVHTWRADRGAAWHLHSDARDRSCGHGAFHEYAGRRAARRVQHSGRRRRAAHGDLRARYHALHLRLDYHAVDDDCVSRAGGAEEGRRGGSEGHQPVHALRHGFSGRDPSVWHRRRPGARAGHRSGAWIVLPHDRDGYAHGWHHSPDVDRRTDHQPRRRQRDFTDHFRGHRGPFSARPSNRHGPARPIH